MKKLMTMAAAVALLAGVSGAKAENASANIKGDTVMEQSSAPKLRVKHKSKRMHHAMRVRHKAVRETTGFGGRVGPIGGPRNDPSIHQSAGDRDSRGLPKQR